MVGFQANNTYGGTGYAWLSRNDGGSGITMWGGSGSADEPRLTLSGRSRTVVLNMAESGDDAVQLPSSSISSIEMRNEPGLSTNSTTSPQILSGTPKQLRYVYINCPTNGYVVVYTTFNLITQHNTSTSEFIYLKITDEASASFPSTYSYMKSYLAPQPCCQYVEPVTLMRYFNVSSGGQYFYLYGTEYYGHTSVDDILMTAVFVPTWYGFLIPGAPGMEDGFDSPEPVQSEMERIIDERVKQEAAAIETRFEQRLAALKEELLHAKEK